MTKSPEKSLRSPLGQARGLGSAKEGAAHWWMIRATSLPLIPLSIYFLTQLDHITSPDRAMFIAWLQQPVALLCVIVFVLSAFYHAMLGMQEIIEDYVHGHGLKMVVLLINKFSFLLLALITVYAALALHFGKF